MNIRLGGKARMGRSFQGRREDWEANCGEGGREALTGIWLGEGKANG